MNQRKYLGVIMHADFKISHRNYPLWIQKEQAKTIVPKKDKNIVSSKNI